MEPTNEMDELLKRSMHFDPDEVPEPEPRIQLSLRKKVISKRPIKGNPFVMGLVRLLNRDIKLYHAGIAIAAVSLIFIALRHTTEAPREYKQGIIVADTNVGSSLKDDAFLVKNFSTRVN